MGARNNVYTPIDTMTATIANAASLSDVQNASGMRPVGLQMPAAWTTAALTFAVSYDKGVTYAPLYDGAGNEYTVQAAASRAIALDPAVFSGVRYFKIRSGTNGSPVTQGAARAIGIMVQK